MSNLHNFFGITAIVVSVISFAPYLISILKNKTKPSAASWWTWAILSSVAVASSWSAGGNWQVLLLPAWLVVSQLIVALLSIRYGDNKWDIQNKIYAISALVSILVWVITGSSLIALGLVILADLFASIPNLRHVYSNPEQEDKLAWSLGWVSSIFAVLAIGDWTFASYGWAMYFLLNMSVVTFFLFRKTLFKTKN